MFKATTVYITPPTPYNSKPPTRRLAPRPPSPIRRRPSNNQKPILIAHRCGSGEAPENTIAAARQSLERCSSLILHVDLLLTADKEVVCFHDQEPHERNMLKMTGRDSSISFFEFKHLPPLLSRIPTNPLCDLGGYIDTTKYKRDGRNICKFEEVRSDVAKRRPYTA